MTIISMHLVFVSISINYFVQCRLNILVKSFQDDIGFKESPESRENRLFPAKTSGRALITLITCFVLDQHILKKTGSSLRFDTGTMFDSLGITKYTVSLRISKYVNYRIDS